MNEHEFESMLKNAKWKHSEQGNSHEYILEIDYPDLVYRVQELLKKEGKREKFKHYWQRYWFHKGYRYWIMPGIYSPTLPKTLVLNRTNQTNF